MTKKKQNKVIQGIQKSLREVMSREIRVLRELLANMQSEQQCHLNNDPETLKQVLGQREPLVQHLAEDRDHRLKLISELATALKKEIPEDQEIDTELSLELLKDYADEESCEVLLLRDQMLALLEQLRNTNGQNNYLIENKLSHTKELIQRLHPADPNTTYGAQGKKQAKKTTVTVINQEV